MNKSNKVILIIVAILLISLPLVSAYGLTYKIGEYFRENTKWWAASTAEGTDLPWYDRHGQAIDFIFFMLLFMAITHIALSKAVGKEWKDAGAKNAAIALAIILGAAMGIAAVKAGMSVTFFVPFVKNVLFFIVWFLVFLLLKILLGDKHKIIMMLFALLITYLLFNVASIVLDKDRKFDLANMIGIPTAEESCYQVEAKLKRKEQEFVGFKNSLRVKLKQLFPNANLADDDILYQKLVEWESNAQTNTPPQGASNATMKAVTDFINGLSKSPSKKWKEYEEDILKLKQRIVDCRKKGLMTGDAGTPNGTTTSSQTLSGTGTPDTCYFWNPATQKNLEDYKKPGALPWSEVVALMNKKGYTVQGSGKCGDDEIRIAGLVENDKGVKTKGQAAFRRGKRDSDPMTYYYAISVDKQTKIGALCKANTACWKPIKDGGYHSTNLLSDGLFGPITRYALANQGEAKYTSNIAIDKDPFILGMSIELNLIYKLEGRTDVTETNVSKFNPAIQANLQSALGQYGNP